MAITYRSERSFDWKRFPFRPKISLQLAEQIVAATGTNSDVSRKFGVQRRLVCKLRLRASMGLPLITPRAEPKPRKERLTRDVVLESGKVTREPILLPRLPDDVRPAMQWLLRPWEARHDPR